jgi:hypothetical protein
MNTLNTKGQTELSQVCLDNDLEGVKRLIKADPSSVSEENWNGGTALCVAAAFSKLEIIEIVLKATPSYERNKMNQYHDNAYDSAYRYREEDTEERRDIIKLLEKYNISSSAVGYTIAIPGLGIVHAARCSCGKRTWR